MRLNRRQFVRISAVAAFAGGACKTSSKPTVAPSSKCPSPPAASTLQIDFEGLYMFERQGSSIVVHLIDAVGVGLPAHAAEMSVDASTIDQTKTAKPSPGYVQPAGNGEIWHWDLTGLDVAGPGSANGAIDLTTDQSSSEDGQPMPTDDAGWHSFARVLDLRVLCGATKISAPSSAFTSSITLTHGHLGVFRPCDPIGQQVVWAFTDPSGKLLMRRALSNLLGYVCPSNGAELTIKVGSQQVVFKADAAPQVTLSNLPKIPVPCLNCPPNMDHFSAFVKLVDAKFTPSIKAETPNNATYADVGAGYCPGGQI